VLWCVLLLDPVDTKLIRSIFCIKLGAYLIESRLGRRWSLAGSTFITAFFCVVFVLVKSTWAVRVSTVGISLSATVSTISRFLVLIVILTSRLP